MIMKNQEEKGPRTLRDKPVPPVKGAVTEHRDAIARPDAEQNARGVDFYDALRFELWQ